MKEIKQKMQLPEITIDNFFTSQDEMVNQYIDPKYEEYTASVVNEIVKLIPNDLYISQDNKKIFIKD